MIAFIDPDDLKRSPSERKATLVVIAARSYLLGSMKKSPSSRDTNLLRLDTEGSKELHKVNMCLGVYQKRTEGGGGSERKEGNAGKNMREVGRRSERTAQEGGVFGLVGFCR